MEYGTLFNINDLAIGARNKYCPYKIPPSELHYNIPYEWCVNGIGIMHHLTTVHQFTSIDEKGITTTYKSGVLSKFHFSDKSINIEEIELRNYKIATFVDNC